MRLPYINRHLIALTAAMLLIAGRGFSAAHARPIKPDTFPQVIGTPGALSAYWHDQRWTADDQYACALYAQASVLEAFGYDFEEELAAARILGIAQGWYLPGEGTIGLGQPLRARGIAFEVHSSPLDPPVPPDRALWRLQLALAAGRYALVNVNAQALSYYRGSAVRWHTLWITGLRLDANGIPTTVIANDSYRGAAVEYAVDEFLDAWGHTTNFYGIFVTPRETAHVPQPNRPRLHPEYPLPSHLQGYP